MTPPRLASLLLAGLFAALSARATSITMHSIPASDPRIRYEGRIDLRDPAEPVLIWSGTRVLAAFEGRGLALRFGPRSAQSVFNATVDGVTEVVDLRGAATGETSWEWPHTLPAGVHRLELFKRSEAAKGHTAFRGLAVAGGDLRDLPPAPARVRFEFFGDSITAGACNEDGAVDQWEDFRPHNHALSYANLTSQAFGADHRAVAISGIGIIIGYVEPRAGEIWNALYPEAKSPRADLTKWQPDVVFVNYGENDTSFTGGHGMPFPKDWTPKYVELVRAIRGAYGQAHIVLLRGGMAGGAKDPHLAAAWGDAVRELEAGDPKISHFVFQHWSNLHPRVSDDRAMADELVAWLRQQSWLPVRP